MNDLKTSYSIAEDFLNEFFTYQHDIDFLKNREFFRTKHMIELMQELKNNPNTQDIVRNSILTLNALTDDELPLDNYYVQGKDLENLSLEERAFFKSKLIAECVK
ncbi:MAG: hypothetical protein ACFFAS_07860 [Promethearchaeota archaeon]